MYYLLLKGNKTRGCGPTHLQDSLEHKHNQVVLRLSSFGQCEVSHGQYVLKTFKLMTNDAKNVYSKMATARCCPIVESHSVRDLNPIGL